MVVPLGRRAPSCLNTQKSRLKGEYDMPNKYTCYMRCIWVNGTFELVHIKNSNFEFMTSFPQQESWETSYLMLPIDSYSLGLSGKEDLRFVLAASIYPDLRQKHHDIEYTPPWKLTYPLKIQGWKMTSPFTMVPFQGIFVHFGGVHSFQRITSRFAIEI